MARDTRQEIFLMRIKSELSWQTEALLAYKKSGRGDPSRVMLVLKNMCRKERNRKKNTEKDETQGKLAGGINEP